MGTFKTIGIQTATPVSPKSGTFVKISTGEQIAYDPDPVRSLPVVSKETAPKNTAVKKKAAKTTVSAASKVPAANTLSTQTKAAKTVQRPEIPARKPAAVDPAAYGWDPMVADDLQRQAEQGRPGHLRQIGTGRGGRRAYQTEDNPGLGRRVLDFTAGAGKSYAGQMAGLGGLFADLMEQTDSAARSGTTQGRRALQEAENLKSYQAMLDRGTWNDGRPLSQEDRAKIAGWMDSAQRFIDVEQAYLENVHRPIQAASDAAYGAARGLTEAGQRDIERSKEGLGAVGRFLVDVGVAGEQMALDFAPAVLTGGGSALLPMFLRSSGGAALAAEDAGAGFGTKAAYALGSGALSVATEQISNVAGPFRKVFGAGAADRIAARLAARFGENGAVKVMSGLASSAAGHAALAAFGEGFEEVVENFGQAFLQEATIAPTDNAPPNLTSYVKNSLAKFDPVQAGYEFLVGAALGGLGGAVDGVRTAGVRAEHAADQAREAHNILPERMTDLRPAETQTRPQGDFGLLEPYIIRDSGQEVQQPDGSQLDAPPLPPQLEQDLARREADRLVPPETRVRQTELSNEDFALLAEDGRFGLDAEGRVFRVNPEEHIDRRSAAEIGDRKLNAFQFDHPELHGFFADAARWLKGELAAGQKGGEYIRERTEHGLVGDILSRTSRGQAEPVVKLLDEFGLSYNEISKALDAIIQDQGQENYAAAKKVELVLDEMLTNGWKSADGRPNPGTPAYVEATSKIAGSLNAGQEAAPLTPDSPDGTILEMAGREKTYYERRAEEESGARPESKSEFLGRGRQGLLETVERGENTYGFRTVRGRPSGVAGGIQEELTALGVPGVVVESEVEWNRGGYTKRSAIPQAITIWGNLVLIGKDASVNPINVAAHEAYHFWKGTDARMVFEDVLGDQLLFTSEAFQQYQELLTRKYFGKEMDLSDAFQQDKFTEELFAYLAGDIHSGENEAQLRAMFRDYDAVKAAWNALAEYGRTHPAELPSSLQQADGLGAADAGTVQSDFQRMQGETDQFHPINPDAAQRTAEEQGRAPSDVPVENPGTGENIRKTVSTILNSPITSNEMALILERAIADNRFDYGVITDRAALMQAQEEVRKSGYKDLVSYVLANLELGRANKYDTVLAAVVYNEAKTAGDHAAALDLAIALSGSATEHAQALQAMQMFNRMTPEGKLAALRRTADRMNARLNRRRGPSLNALDTEAQRADFVERRTGFTISDELAADYLLAQTQEESDAAWDAIIQDLAAQAPVSFLDRWHAWRYLSMLANPKTHIRNTVGNVLFGILQRRTKNFIGTGLERAFVRDPGQRTKSVLTPADKGLRDFAQTQYEADQGLAMGQRKYTESGGNAIEREIMDRRNLLGPLQRVADWNSAQLDREDAWFNQPAYVDSFAQALKAKGVTAEEAASGQKTELVEAARAYAVKEAQKATFRDANAFSDFVASLGRSGDRTNPFTRALSAAVDIKQPFRRTPANVLVRGVEYSPAGLLKALSYDAAQVRNGAMTPVEMIDHLSSGLTGSAVFALGAFLAWQGLLALRPGGDKQERDFLSSAGFQDFALQLPGGGSYTLGWAAPSAIPLFAGAAMSEAFRAGGGTGAFVSFLSAMAGMTDSILETSMMSSMKSMLDGIGYAENKIWYLVSSTIMDFLSQSVPAVLSNAASAMDGTVRSSYVPTGTPEAVGDVSFFLQGIQRKIPGARNAMQPKIDLWGREVSNGGTGERFLESFLSPGFYSQAQADALEQELLRLKDVTGSSAVFPSSVEKSFKVDGETKYLTAEEYTTYAKTVGQTRYAILSSLVNREGYQKLSDADKAKTIAAVYSYAVEVGKMEVSGYQPDSETTKELMNSPLDPATYFLYRRMMSVENDKDQSGAQANANVRNALKNDSSLSAQEKNLLDDWIIHDITVLDKGLSVDYSSDETFTISQMSDSAQKHWDLVRERTGISAADYQTAWEICQRRGTQAEPYTASAKKRDLQTELGVSYSEAAKIYAAINAKVD